MKSLAPESEKRALEFFENGRNCAQSVVNGVLETLYSEKNVDYNPNIAQRVARGFGGGMMAGEMCGAITGGIIAAGLFIEDTGDVKNFVKDIVSSFEHEYKNVRCDEIKETPMCKKYVAFVARQATEILERTL